MAAESGEGSGVMMIANMGNEVSLSELMEVVTTYKCRFCAHTCPSTQDMADHVQRIHINPAAINKDMGRELETVAEPDLMGDIEENQEDPSVFETPNSIMSSLGLCPAKPEPAAVNAVSAQSKLVPAQASSLSLVTTTQPGIFSLAGGTVTHNLAITAIQLTGSGLTLPTQPTVVDTVCMMDTNRDLGTGPASIAPITRELFLCGICNLGFVSVEECKLHMERDEHGTIAEPPVDAGDSKGRVSVGTQVSGKRPGRKRKSELPPPEELPSAKKSTWKRPHYDLTHTDDLTDADWIPGHSLSISKRDGRTRRKIRPPKALKEDYVIVKKRKYRKQRQVYKEHYTLTCSYLGCLAKFRTQVALDTHLSCHNQQDTGFTCCQCQQPFPAWKALRIHLWRMHTVDVDLCQCDVCDYKTDTLHKLGIHQEIHSDTRPYTCDVCGKGFKQLSQMKNHQIIHEEHRQGSNINWFTSKTCSICSRVFANSKCLKKHVEAVHIKVKPFVCQYCDHSTARKAMMELHLRTHTGEKPFKCDVCPYATGDHNSLRRHKMRHTGQRQYKCQLCSYTCIQTISLKTHMRKKHPNAEGLYKCPDCKFRTINKQIYNNHMSDHRNGLLPIPPKVSEEDPESTAASTSSGTDVIISQPMQMQTQVQTLKVEDSEPTAASASTGADVIISQPVQVQMQVQTMKSGEVQVSAEDLAKLSGVEGLVSGEISAVQLIYSALSVISQGRGKARTQTQLLNGIQTTVTTSSSSDKEGVSTHTITFRLPAQVTGTPRVSSTDQAAGPQLLTEQEGSEQEDSSEANSLEGSDAPDRQQTLLSEAQAFEQVTQVLCAEVPKLLAAGSSVLSHDHGMQMMQVQCTSDGHTTVLSMDKATSPASSIDGSTAAAASSESGGVVSSVDDVLLAGCGQTQNMVVSTGGQLVDGMLVVATGGQQDAMVMEGGVAAVGEDARTGGSEEDQKQVLAVTHTDGDGSHKDQNQTPHQEHHRPCSGTNQQ